MTKEMFIPRRTLAQLPCVPANVRHDALAAIESLLVSWKRTHADAGLAADRRARKLAGIERMFIAELERIDRACGAIEQYERDCLRDASSPASKMELAA